MSGFILVPTLSGAACKDSHTLDEASGIDLQPLVPSTKILQWQMG
jgi:hypothetical protein